MRGQRVESGAASFRRGRAGVWVGVMAFIWGTPFVRL
jgi:hypothetical protein